MHLQVLTREWRRYKVRFTEARLGHTETGLATRPLFGAAPQMPEGHDPDHAVGVMLEAVAAGTALLPSLAFSPGV
jgi:cyclic-di-GMP-binding biofilm dispersal mediator protein